MYMHACSCQQDLRSVLNMNRACSSIGVMLETMLYIFFFDTAFFNKACPFFFSPFFVVAAVAVLRAFHKKVPSLSKWEKKNVHTILY